MKTRLISLLLGASCALYAGAEVKVDTAMPGGCLAKAEIDGDKVHLTRDYRDTEGVQQSGYGYRAADDLPFGKFWNKGRNYTQGKTLNLWAQQDLGTCRFVTSIEVPFANQHEKTLYPKDWNGFGRDVLLAYREYLQMRQR